jgi:hypothetical protein
VPGDHLLRQLRPLHGTRYQGGHGYYECNHARSDHTATTDCRSVRADTVDEAVTTALLDAVAPDQLALALAAADEVTQRRQRSVRAAELAVERARYQAERAERAFHACEPENRLVARSLEARWETKLTELTETQAALAAQQQAHAPLPPPEQLHAAVADLHRLWRSPTTCDKDRKRLLRTLVGDITLRPAGDPARLGVGLRWNSGATTQLLVQRAKPVTQWRRTAPEAIDLARRIGPPLDNAALAAALNQAGHATGTGRPFDVDAAANLRHYHHIPFPGLLADGELTPRQVAELIGVSVGTVHYWITTGFLHARRGPAGRWCVPFPPRSSTPASSAPPALPTSTPTSTPPHAPTTSAASPTSPPDSASSPTSSTTGPNAATSPPAAAPPVAFGSASPLTSRPPACSESPPPTSSRATSKPKPHNA